MKTHPPAGPDDAAERLRQRERLLSMAGRIARVGGWSVVVPEFALTWSDETAAIHDEPPGFSSPLDAAIDYYVPDYRATVRHAFEACVRDGAPFDIEAEIITARGRRVWVRSIGEAERDAAGRIVRVQGACQDISDRKQAEEEQRRLAERFTTTLESITDGFFTLDREWHFTYVNAEAERMILRPRAELLGITIWEAFPAMAGSAFERAYHRSLGENITVTFEEYFPPLEKWFDVRAYPSEQGLAVYFRDVSEARRQREAVRASEERFRLLARATNDAIWDWDLVSNALWWNDGFETLFGFQRAEVEPTIDSWLHRLHPEDREATVADVHRAIDGGAVSWAGEYRFRCKDGRYSYVLDRGHIIRAASGEVVRMIGGMTDLTERKENEQAAARALQRLNDAQRIGQIGDWEWDVSKDTITWSQQVFAITGRDPSLGPPASYEETTETFETASRERLKENITRALETGEPQYYELTLLRPNGERVEVQAAAIPKKDESGRVTGLYGTIQDITARQRAEEQVRQSAANLAVAQCIAHFGSWTLDLTDPDVDRNPLQWSDEMFRIAGFEPGAVEVSNDLFFRLVPPEEHEAIHQAVATALREREGYSIVHRLIRPDGTERTVHEAAQIFFDERTGQPLRMIGTAHDITEQRQAEQQIIEQAALIDQARDAILVHDLAGRITFWSKGAERLYGWTSAEALGQHFEELLQGEPALLRAAAEVLTERGEWRGEVQKITKAGARITLDCRWTVLRNAEGGPRSYLHIDTDITDQKKIEQQFLRAQRMESIGTLAGGIAHDLNNVLAPIIMALEVLKMRFPDPASRALISTLESSAQHGAGLVRQVLAFGRGVEGQKIEVQIRHLIKDVEKIANETFLKNIQVRPVIPGDLWTVIGDPTQLHQVLLNLCVNARDAMPGGGTLILSAENRVLDAHYAGLHLEAKPGPYVFLQVEDTGTGIPRDVIEKIFDPFFTTKEFGHGTGLGLSTSLGIVKSHGGFIQVYSEVGKGSKFKIYLPAQTEAPAALPTAPKVKMPRGEGELILVVDDEPAVRQITSRTLEAFGYRVVVAADGVEAVATYAEHAAEIRAVLTDMMMPVMDGPALIQVLRTMNPALPIIAASGLDANGKVAQAANLGVKYFLPKPYTAETLLRTLRQILPETTSYRPDPM